MTESSPVRRTLRPLLAVLATVALAFLAAACGGDDDSGEASASGESAGGNVNLVAYSTPQEVYEGELEPAFQATSDGQGVEFRNSFGSSGEQSRAVEAGQPADLVHLSLETDMTRLVDAGIVSADWQQGEYEGILQNSVVSLITRPGNPKDIKGWDDLTRDDVEVVNPNPFTSGGARWNVMAIYGSQIERGKSPEEALDFVEQVLRNVETQDKSAAEALTTFLGGKGDVLVSYENEAIRAQQSGEDVDYVIPDETLLIETPVAIPSDAENPEGAQAFLDYLYTDEGQSAFAEAGYRPVVESVAKQYEDEFPVPQGLFTIEDLGGWADVSAEFFDPDTGSVAEINRNLGQATG